MTKDMKWHWLTDQVDNLIQAAFDIRKSEGCRDAFDDFQKRIGDAVKDFHDVVFAGEIRKEKR